MRPQAAKDTGPQWKRELRWSPRTIARKLDVVYTGGRVDATRRRNHGWPPEQAYLKEPW